MGLCIITCPWRRRYKSYVPEKDGTQPTAVSYRGQKVVYISRPLDCGVVVLVFTQPPSRNKA